MPATPSARLTTPTTKLATYADLYRTPETIYAVTPMCSIQQERKGHDDAMRRYHDLGMQVRCGDGIRPIPSNSRDPQTAGGLRADTRVLERRLIPKPCLGQVLGVIESVIMRRMNRQRPARRPKAIEAKLIAARLNANDGVMVPVRPYATPQPPEACAGSPKKRCQREGTKNSCSRTLCVPAVALNLHASPPPRMPSPRSTAGETMPVRGTMYPSPHPSALAEKEENGAPRP
ncbi:hypothetical protein FB107DRAFT_280226 [Schizophyllum commune]